MNELVEEFLKYLASERGLAKNTLQAYRSDLLALRNFLQQKGIVDFSAVQQTDILNFLESLKTQQYATASIGRTLIAIKVFYRFAVREKLLPKNIMLDLGGPKLEQLLPEVLTGEEMERLLAQPDTATALGARDRAILELLYGSGLRVSELCALSIYDLDDTFVRVMGKGSKERIVPIGRKAIEAIDYYLGQFRTGCESEKAPPLFTTRRGARINRLEVWKLIKQYARKAGIAKNISPHTLRHTFATHLLDHGADLRIIQEMLGHASITSTDRYTHVSQTKIQAAFQQFHPRN